MEREFICWKKIRLIDDTEMKLTIYQEGSLQIIWDPISGNEYTIHPSSKSIDDAISALFNIKEIDTCMPDLDSV